MAASKTSLSVPLILAISIILIRCAEGRDHLVGGRVGAWKVPSSETESLNKWAESSRFQVGDYLVWEYDGKKDSVLQVTRDAYHSCNTTRPIEEYRNGETKVRLDRSGPFYFISGAEGHCEKGQKLIVVVMAPRRNKQNALASPAPSPAEVEAPAISPTSSATTRKGSMLVVLGVIFLVI
ncbi:hypothetical protein Nepgr_009846 [Nepenthes gracilis]|uniref:Phytocyanin domain-containing protein n=1 Tax=Nepenthes gracilis TaxID=150966 RepID=A0AAD3SBW4_NEPGR|nr:hypothetical protein Nepgr_009846 [Nepenthes gracilis]